MAKESKPKKEQNPTRRQHWLPCTSYLQNFTTEGKVHVYWFGDKGKTNFTHTADQKDIAPVNIAVKKDLYETPDLPQNTVENVLATIEGLYSKVLEDKIKQGKELTEDEHEQVALYISALENRTMLQQAHINEFLSRLDETGRNIALGHNSQEAAADWSEKVSETKDELFAQAVGISLMVNKWDPLDFCFLNLAKYVHLEFITSDHPVSIVDFVADNSVYGLNHWSKTAECIVPLTHTIALFANRCGITGYKEIDHNFVREINNRTLRRADKMLITKQPVSDEEADAIIKRNPQSLLLLMSDGIINQ